MPDNHTLSSRLSDPQWELVAPLISNRSPALPSSVQPRGRPRKPRGRPLASDRAVLDAIIYVINNDIPFSALPVRTYPSPATCLRRYSLWRSNGTWDAIFDSLLDDLHRRTGVNLWREWSRFSIRLAAGDSQADFYVPEIIRLDPSNRLVGTLFIRYHMNLYREAR